MISSYSIEKKINGYAPLGTAGDLGKTENGGKGSGNFGHAGRPGKIGGSGKGDSAPQSLKEAQEKEKKAKRVFVDYAESHRGEDYDQKIADKLGAELDSAKEWRRYYEQKEAYKTGKTEKKVDKKPEEKMSEDDATRILDEIADDVMGGDLSDFDEYGGANTWRDNLVPAIQSGNLDKKQVKRLMEDGFPQLSKDKRSIYRTTFAGSDRGYVVGTKETNPKTASEDLKEARKLWKDIQEV